MAQSPYACLEGTVVTIDAIVGAFRSCGYCAHNKARLTLKSSGGHAAHLNCLNCGTLTAWLSVDHLAAMKAQRDGEGRVA